MRQRFQRARGSAMARRPGEDGRFSLSPRARRIGGWLAAALLVLGIAVIVGVLGGDGDGTSVVPSPSASTSSTPEAAEIRFGTAIDPVTGEVSEESSTPRFVPGDPFAYSVRPAEPPPTQIYVEVERIEGGPSEVVQPPSEQDLAEGAEVIAFVVPTTDLVAAFGTGEFVMRIYADPTGEPIADGTFALAEAAESAPSATP